MKPVTREWVAKAEADLLTASREHRRRIKPNLDVVCFLAQQCAEKYIKARLQQESVVFGKIHDLVKLIACLPSPEPALVLIQPALQALSAYAVVFRYPGRSATRTEATDALRLAQRVREIIREALSLPVASTSMKKRSITKTKKNTPRTKRGR